MTTLRFRIDQRLGLGTVDVPQKVARSRWLVPSKHRIASWHCRWRKEPKYGKQWLPIVQIDYLVHFVAALYSVLSHNLDQLPDAALVVDYSFVAHLFQIDLSLVFEKVCSRLRDAKKFVLILGVLNVKEATFDKKIKLNFLSIEQNISRWLLSTYLVSLAHSTGSKIHFKLSIAIRFFTLKLIEHFVRNVIIGIFKMDLFFKNFLFSNWNFF